MLNLVFEKIWEDLDFYEVRFFAQSDFAQVYTTTYITPGAIEELSERLKDFPKTRDDIFCWENGEHGSAVMPFISLEFLCKDWNGHIEIKIYMEFENEDVANGYHCCFALSAESGQLNRWGRALLRLNSLGIGTRIQLADTGEDKGTVRS